MIAAKKQLACGRWPASGGATVSMPKSRVIERTDYHVGDCLIPATLVALVDAANKGVELSTAAARAVNEYNRCAARLQLEL